MHNIPKLRPGLGWIAAAALAATVAAAPANACRMYRPLQMEDLRFADLVVAGHISNYRIVRDVEFRRKMLASPNLSEEDRGIYKSGTNLLPDFARFEIIVDEVLAGTAPKRLSVIWNNSTFQEPETMAAGRFLIALRRPGQPPLPGPSPLVPANPDPNSLTLLQSQCSSPFMFEAGSDEARAMRRFLAARRKLRQAR